MRPSRFASSRAPIRLLLFCLIFGSIILVCNAWISCPLLHAKRIRNFDSLRRHGLAAASLQRKDDPAEESVVKEHTSINATTVSTKPQQSSTSDPFIRETSFQTALVIVPPDRAWDSLQRARHFAKDSTYSKWPPCLRLFHPFCLPEQISNVAMDLALIVEEANMEPFDITLSQWTILPHAELLQADALAVETMMPASSSSGGHAADSMSELQFLDEDDKIRHQEIQDLIRSEEKLGKIRKRRRQLQQLRRKQATGEHETEVSNGDVYGGSHANEESHEDREDFLSADERIEQSYEEYDGPCVICLEPDTESQQKLQQLREFLRPLLFDAPDYYSPTSSVSKTTLVIGSSGGSSSDNSPTFRPVVPIGTFSSVATAIPIARKLRGLLGAPLKFSVTDLQFISCLEKEQVSRETSWLAHAHDDEMSLSEMTEQFGCDAMVMLMGEEMEPLEEELGQDVAELLLDKGEAGGKATASDAIEKGTDFADDDADNSSASRSLEDWLYNDDEYDEGSVVVIGRTHFFTGENRMYVGMPASSSKDRKPGKGVSGEARRKNPGITSQRMWSAANYGTVDQNILSEPRVARPYRKRSDQNDSGWDLLDDD